MSLLPNDVPFDEECVMVFGLVVSVFRCDGLVVHVFEQLDRRCVRQWSVNVQRMCLGDVPSEKPMRRGVLVA
eukprot:13834549-Alexandrium_andersonii.AAC.1